MPYDSKGQFIARQFKHDLVGREFGRLRVLPGRPWRENNETMWMCQCSCGTVKPIEQKRLLLKRKAIKSCGCLARDPAPKRKHGGSNTKEYWVWHSMIRRCHDPNDRRYPKYGGRGISVCDRWRGSFGLFMEDMGARPEPSRSGQRISIDRIDNNGNYEPGNCRWATPEQQGRNNRRTRMLTFGGEKRPLVEWSEITRIPPSTIWERLRVGCSVEEALTAPRGAKLATRKYEKKPSPTAAP